MLVLDASAAVEIVLQKPMVSMLQEALSSSATVVAPDLFVSEITNVFWKYSISGMPMVECEEACRRALALPDALLTVSEYWQEALAFSVKNRITAYDAFYAVITQRNHGTLVTMDSKLSLVCRQNGILVNNPR